MIANSQNRSQSQRGVSGRRGTEASNLLAMAIRVMGRVSLGGSDLTADFATDNLPIVHFWKDGF